jgi:hypothetical protein
MPDWLVAQDDLLCQRLHTCTDCGCGARQMWTGIFALPGDQHVAYQVCSACKAKAGGEQALRAKLAQRYCAHYEAVEKRGADGQAVD